MTAKNVYVNSLLIFVVSDAMLLLMTTATSFEPVTTATKTVAKTKAYSSKSWPDSPRCKSLMSAFQVKSDSIIHVVIGVLRSLKHVNTSSRYSKSQESLPMKRSGAAPHGLVPPGAIKGSTPR
jgi:hypothetical protein